MTRADCKVSPWNNSLTAKQRVEAENTFENSMKKTDEWTAYKTALPDILAGIEKAKKKVNKSKGGATALQVHEMSAENSSVWSGSMNSSAAALSGEAPSASLIRAATSDVPASTSAPAPMSVPAHAGPSSATSVSSTPSSATSVSSATSPSAPLRSTGNPAIGGASVTSATTSTPGFTSGSRYDPIYVEKLEAENKMLKRKRQETAVSDPTKTKKSRKAKTDRLTKLQKLLKEGSSTNSESLTTIASSTTKSHDEFCSLQTNVMKSLQNLVYALGPLQFGSSFILQTPEAEAAEESKFCPPCAIFADNTGAIVKPQYRNLLATIKTTHSTSSSSVFPTDALEARASILDGWRKILAKQLATLGGDPTLEILRLVYFCIIFI